MRHRRIPVQSAASACRKRNHTHQQRLSSTARSENLTLTLSGKKGSMKTNQLGTHTPVAALNSPMDRPNRRLVSRSSPAAVAATWRIKRHDFRQKNKEAVSHRSLSSISCAHLLQGARRRGAVEVPRKCVIQRRPGHCVPATRKKRGPASGSSTCFVMSRDTERTSIAPLCCFDAGRGNAAR